MIADSNYDDMTLQPVMTENLESIYRIFKSKFT